MSSHPKNYLQRGRLVAGLAALLLACLWPSTSPAQSGIGDIVYTVGTTVHDSHGRDWAYILWQGTELGLVSNRVFAVYSKPGEATNNAPFTRLSLVSVQTDARVIEPLLERAANLGDDLLKLDQDLGQLFGSFIPPSSITRAEQLSAVIRGSQNNADFYQNLMLLARNHAGINLALGYADAELIPPGTTTFEVRAFDPVTSQDLAVVGRVTVEAGNPTILPPPGPPVLVPENTPKGDLNLKFRWGTPDNLRRLGLIQFGYNLYRVERGYAVSHGWNAGTPPPDNVLLGLILTNPAAARKINTVPLTPSKFFTVPAAADLSPVTGDTNSFFIMDDDGRGHPMYFNSGWTNGAQFFYYVAARDVLGRDGIFSSGLLATVCDRMPPMPPTGVHVRNDYQFDPVTLTTTQALRIDWKQNLGTNDPVVNYWVYRWTNTVEMNALSGNPANNLIAIVGQIPGATNNSYLDLGPGSPTAQGAYGKTFWYTVRAADAGACGQNFSGAGGPAYGVLRQRVGPGAGTGYIEINCLEPFVTFVGNRTSKQPPDTTNFDLLLTCTRLDPRFEWAEFYGIATYTLGGVAGPPVITTISNYFGRLDYLDQSLVSAWWTPPHDPSGVGSQYSSITMQVGCRAALNNGKISDYNLQTIPPPGAGTYTEVDFKAVAQSIRTVAGPNKRYDCYEHDPGGGGGGVYGTNNIGVHVNPTPGSKEYRLYRRVDDGPLSLLCNGSITNLTQFIECFEDAPPVNGGTICFFLQLLDENGNPSPLTPLGCVDTAPSAALPTPVLAPIAPVGTDPTNAAMSLSWFCPPYGVDRFEVRVAALPTRPNTNLFAISPQLFSDGTPPVVMLFTNGGTNITLPFYTFVTPKVGPGFGNNGAQFSVPCAIELGKKYYVAVRALSRHNNPGDFSNFEPFIWVPSNTPTLKVPWPARPLPGTNSSFITVAFYLSATNSAAVLRTGSPDGNGVLIGYGNVGFRKTSLGRPPQIFGPVDPNSMLETNVQGDPIFPCALYRYQVANPLFPTVSGDVIQVSPLMENIAYQWTGVPGQSTNTIIHDPFVAVTGVSVSNGTDVYLWLRDQQPQISGARYKYILVRFNPVTHEIDQLIPSNEVAVP